MENFEALIKDHFVLVVFVACLIVGFIIKSSISVIPNRHIPTIVAVVGAAVNILVSGLSVESVVYGALMGLASTGCHQLFKQWINRKNDTGSSNTENMTQ